MNDEEHAIVHTVVDVNIEVIDSYAWLTRMMTKVS